MANMQPNIDCPNCTPDTAILDAFRDEWQWLYPDVKIYHKFETLEDGCYAQSFSCPHLKEHYIKMDPREVIPHPFGFECQRDMMLDYVHEMLHYGRTPSAPPDEDAAAYMMWEQDIEQTARWLVQLKRENDALKQRLGE